MKYFSDIYKNKKVLVTGHTGFKGSWMCLWLEKLGAEVYGIALDPPSAQNHFEQLNLQMKDIRLDIRNREQIQKEISAIQPDIVFHLAAQPLVRTSYEIPIETWETNVIGSLNIYEACRNTASVRVIVSITTDKVYENKEWCWGYRENDPLGGHDPYSASKAGADIATTSFRRSFWPTEEYGKSHHVLMAQTRAGNVIGGGDWAKDRLIPDLMRGAQNNEEAILRNPSSTRPWEHVLEPLSGYFLLGQKLWEKHSEYAKPWNFGPAEVGVLPVSGVVQALSEAWPKLKYRIETPKHAPHEAGLLTLDCSQARTELQWKPVWDGPNCFYKTAEWYREYLENSRVISVQQLEEYQADATKMNLCWTQDMSDSGV